MTTDDPLSILREFTRYPGGRLPKSGPHSGYELRERILKDRLRSAIANGTRLSVNIDGVSTYAGSFLEEAFGGLVREGFTLAELKKHLVIVGTGEFEEFGTLIWTYIEEAALGKVH